MGDTAIDIFLETLKQLITSSKLSLIIEEKHQFQSLEHEIKYLRGFLKVTEKKHNDQPQVMKLVMQIRDLVSEAENIVELFVVHAFKADHLPIEKKKKKKDNKQRHRHLSLDLARVKKGMKTVVSEVKKIYKKNMCEINGVAVKQLKHSSTGSGGIGSGSSRGSHTSKVVKEKVVVGFEEDVKKLIEKLDGGEDKPLEIISIIGAGGGGKTTLAREVYEHPFTSYTFEIRAWINVSQDYDKTRKRNLLIHILESVTPKKHEDYEGRSDDKLGEDVLKCLKGRKYLIVMDDIWGVEAWNDIHRSFPKEFKGSKVLFTSRLVVQLDSVSYAPHYLAPLPKNRCWELLQKKVFGMNCCPRELVHTSEQIAEKCKGLPLAIVTVAGILATEDKTLDVWEKVAKHLSSIIAKNKDGCMEILELSYNHLPLHLKACFLYIGGYPEDKEIPIRELIWLWIAEGFIQQSERGESLETIAKDYLIGLIDRNLIQVALKSPLGKIKACRIHDLLRELCLRKAEDDNFLVTVYEDNSFSPSATNKHRRLFIDDDSFRQSSFREFTFWPRNFHSRNLCSPNLRSFMCLGLREGPAMLVEDLSFFVENFELLRVLNFLSGSCYGQIARGHLVHLRYLAYELCDVSSQLSFRVPRLQFSFLLNLETLNLRSTPLTDFELPLDIFKMVKLRHLYIKYGVFSFDHLSPREARSIGFDHSSKLDSLQTLHQLCACEVCQSLLVRAPNLRELGIYVGEIGKYNNVLRFTNQECFKCLEKLTFTAKVQFDLTTKSTLAPGMKLPLTITRITFQWTYLKWEELSLLQTLPSLEVLKLVDYACSGPVWNTSELEGFLQLKYLRLYVLDIKEWNASEDQFPKLEVLEVELCSKLERIPIDFGSLNELREIKLMSCTRSAEESAREIQEEQRNRKGDDDCLVINLLVTDMTVD